MEKFTLPHQHGSAASLNALREQLCDKQQFDEVSDIFKLLSDSSRVRIFWLLCHAEECVINISALMEMSSPAVSHHLRQLRDAGLIVSRRDGKEVYYTAAKTQQAALLHRAIEKTIRWQCK